MIITQVTPTQQTPAPTPVEKPGSEPQQTQEPVDAHAGVAQTPQSSTPNIVYINGVPYGPVAASQPPVPAQPAPAPSAGQSPCTSPSPAKAGICIAHFAIGALAGGVGTALGAVLVMTPYAGQEGAGLFDLLRLAPPNFLIGLLPGGLAGLAAGTKAYQPKMAITAGAITGAVVGAALMLGTVNLLNQL